MVQRLFANGSSVPGDEAANRTAQVSEAEGSIFTTAAEDSQAQI